MIIFSPHSTRPLSVLSLYRDIVHGLYGWLSTELTQKFLFYPGEQLLGSQMLFTSSFLYVVKVPVLFKPAAFSWGSMGVSQWEGEIQKVWFQGLVLLINTHNTRDLLHAWQIVGSSRLVVVVLFDQPCPIINRKRFSQNGHWCVIKCVAVKTSRPTEHINCFKRSQMKPFTKQNSQRNLWLESVNIRRLWHITLHY